MLCFCLLKHMIIYYVPQNCITMSKDMHIGNNDKYCQSIYHFLSMFKVLSFLKNFLFICNDICLTSININLIIINKLALCS